MGKGRVGRWGDGWGGGDTWRLPGGGDISWILWIANKSTQDTSDYQNPGISLLGPGLGNPEQNSGDLSRTGDYSEGIKA